MCATKNTLCWRDTQTQVEVVENHADWINMTLSDAHVLSVSISLSLSHTHVHTRTHQTLTLSKDLRNYVFAALRPVFGTSVDFRSQQD